MAEITKTDLVAREGDIEATGSLWTKTLAPSEQKKRALKFSGLSLVLSFVSVFIPIAHFVLVPGFLIGSVVLYFMVSRTKTLVQKSEVHCPHCQQVGENLIDQIDFPKQITCDSCRKNFTVSLKTSS